MLLPPPSVLCAANCGPSLQTYLLTEAKRNRNSNLESEIFGWMEKKTLLRPLLSLSLLPFPKFSERASKRSSPLRAMRRRGTGDTNHYGVTPSVALRNERARGGRRGRKGDSLTRLRQPTSFISSLRRNASSRYEWALYTVNSKLGSRWCSG